MNITEKNVIGELVAQDYRTAEVFAKYGIDFCCRGNQSIIDVCTKKDLNANSLVVDLIKATMGNESTNINYQSWPLDLLADYVEKKHHRYVTERIPVIQKYLTKISQVHGKAHPELLIIEKEFDECATALSAHMMKEEQILFPFIRKMVQSQDTHITAPNFGTVQNPINMMKHEHEIEGERFQKISELSNHYIPPVDACNTYKVTFSLLKEFEEDLHLHIHLENNILFPAAIKMESEITRSSFQVL